ncbi:hypothetical protein QVD17_04561 [Tagetes erecta]|uniref:Uncharacterized protein n=1 Tax=Tagetes erecta TaxID=13708 RepID=A0AAD8PAT3_TARER|nr:hypothetical protein QVD17_04561 [Tagetes erecta]
MLYKVYMLHMLAFTKVELSWPSKLRTEMGLHIAVLGLCKLHGATSPFLGTLAWPFLLKVVWSLRPVNNFFTSMVHDSRLLMFQLSQILVFPDDEDGGNRRRRDRIIRLVQQQWPNIGQSMLFSNYDRSLQTLSIVTF